MSKIICEVCGTSYPETSSQCPICGSARPMDTVAAEEEELLPESAGSGYTYVKGGRFSKSNVRKRNKANKNAPGRREELPPEEPKGSGGNRGLTILAIVLLLAIVAVVCYIAIRFFLPIGAAKPDAKSTAPSSTAPIVTTAPTEDLTCKDLSLTDQRIELTAVGGAWRLGATPTPVNTTDSIVYTSANPDIATVTADGLITAVSSGEATITVTCGSVSKQCTVVCNLETTEPTDSTEPSTEPATLANVKLELNREDFTFSYVGEEWMVYDYENPELITWTSDNTNICTVENGLVTSTGYGETEIHAEYGGKSVSCIVRCYPQED